MANASNHDLVLPPQLQRNEQGRFSVKGPISGRMYGIESKYIGSVANQTKGKWVPYVTQSSLSNKRNIRGEAIVLPLTTLAPAPYKKSDITKWYIDVIDTLDEESSKYFKRSIQIRHSQFWLLFCANTPSGLTWFGLYFQHKKNKKTTLPISHSKCLDWTIDAIRVLPYHRDFIAPRGGASLELGDKKVLLVGCGSIGGELACQIAASGVGKIVLSDPDLYNIENIYRHCLPEYCTGLYKTTGLSMKIESQYLWTETVALTGRLDSFCDKSQLEQYDLIVVAIGAPTHERFFADFIENHNVKTPVLYTWLEGYGVGGHVILDCRDGKGCFKCAYVDNDNEEHGLASNLNFIECGQEVTVNHAGCGENFLPYSANASYQTAILASNMAIKYLTGRVTKSSKSSWKGDDTDARCAGLNMTHRYHYFDRSLMIEPLNNAFCCGERL